MVTKLNMRVGQVHLEYEGDSAFDVAAIKDILSHMETVAEAMPPAATGLTASAAQSEIDQEIPGSADFDGLSPNSIAARLGVKTGSDLAIAAAAHLQLCLGKSTFDRKELLATMQSATNYYNAGMSGNLSKTIKYMISGKRINSLSNNQMSLSAAERNNLGGKLAQSE